MSQLRSHSLWLPFCSGIFLALVTPYFGYWQIVSIALLPYGFFVARQPSRPRIFFGTLLMSLPFTFFSGEPLFRLAGTWWVSPLATDTDASLLYPIGIATIIFVAAASYLIPIYGYQHLRTKISIPISAFGLLWALVEFFRSWLLFAGYSWGVVGYALIDAQYIKHAAAIFGVYGLSFLVAVLGMYSGSVIALFYDTHGSFSRRLKYALFAPSRIYDSLVIFLILLFVIAFGVHREWQVPPPSIAMRVAVIASTVPTEDSMGEGSYRLYRHLLLRALVVAPDIVTTPENVFPYFIVDEVSGELAPRQDVYLPNAQILFADLRALSRRYPSVTLALALHSERDALRYNSILFYKNGEIVNIYHKRKPVPFTEFSPLGLRIPLFETITRGARKQNIMMGDTALSGYMCSEIGMTSLSSHSADIIISPSNDSALLSDAIGPLQHQFARMRALESGAYMLRSSKGGISSIIDPYGRAVDVRQGVNDVMIFDIR